MQFLISLAKLLVRTALSTSSDISKSWWRHQMETFSALLAFVQGIHRSPVNSPHKGQWRGALMFSLICTRIYGWVNNREAGDLRRYRALYDVIVMYKHIEAEAKWPPFRRRQFHMYFLEWNVWTSIKISPHLFLRVQLTMLYSIGSDNGLAPVGR